MTKKPKKAVSPVAATTQQFLEIADVRDDIVLLKDMSCATIIEVGAVNYWLLSQDEQSGIIQAYASLLNSLSFPVQILILSKRMDISSYLDYLTKKIEKQPDQNIKRRMESYKEFIKTTVKKTSVLEKRFFFVIPFSSFELGLAKATKSLSRDYVVNHAKTSLYPKRDHLIRLLRRVGLKAEILQKQQISELFYNLYNPSQTGSHLATIENYTKTIHTG